MITPAAGPLTHPTWCVGCDTAGPGSAQPPEVLALIAHDATFGRVGLSRADTVVESETTGEIRYRVGEPHLIIYQDGPIALDDARALAHDILVALDQVAAG